MKRLILSLAFMISGFLAFQAGAQTITNWYDNNGLSPATDGIWDTNTTNWAQSAALSGSTVTYTNGNYAIFAAGSGTTSALNINVAGNVTCSGLGDGTTSTGGVSGSYVTTLNLNDGGGSINLPSGVWPFECGNGTYPAGIYVYATITGPGGLAQHNGAGLALYGNNTYAGGTVATGGQIIYYNSSNSFGTGPISFSGGGTSIWNNTGNIVTLPNAFNVNTGTSVINFAGGNTTCTGPWTLGTTLQLKNNAGNTPVVISGPISGAFGLDLQCDNAGATITLSGANTYSGVTGIGTLAAGTTTMVYISSINSVTTPPQQPSSSLGVPSSVATGTINMGYLNWPGQMIYTGVGETSDRVINLAGTSGGAIIENDGSGPIILSSSLTATAMGSKILTLQGTDTSTNSLLGSVVDNGATGTTTLDVNFAANATTITLGSVKGVVAGAAISGTGIPASDTVKSVNATTRVVTLNTKASAAGTAGETITVAGVINTTSLVKAQSGTWVLTGTNTYTGGTTNSGGILSVNSIADSNPSAIGTSGALGLTGGELQYTGSANATTARAVNLTGTSSSIDLPDGNLEFTGQFKGVANMYFTKTSAGTLTLSGTADNSSLGVTVAQGTVVLNKTSTSTVHALGTGTTVNPGATLQLAGTGGDQIYTGVSLELDGSFDMNGRSEGFKQLSGSGTVGNSSSANCALQIGEGTNAASAFSGQITDGTGGGKTSLTIAATTPTPQILYGMNTYSGPTTINGYLAFGGGGSINNSASISLAAGGTFDVSAQSPFTLSANNASFTAIGNATKTATVIGASGGNVDFASKPVNLSFVPASASGDASHPALTISQGTLLLNNDIINATNASALNLGAGTYTLIQGTNGGSVSVTGSLTLNYSGTALAPNSSASLVAGGGNLNLVVTSSAAPGSFTGVTTQPNGTITLNFTGSPGAQYVIQSTTNLSPAAWTSISTNTAGTNGTFQFNDLTSTNFPMQFYRAIP